MKNRIQELSLQAGGMTKGQELKIVASGVGRSIKMNKRIEELMAQAVRFRLDLDSNAYEAQVSPEDLELFALLIVRECAYIPIDMWDKAELNADVAVKIQDRIKQHFGVEE